ncbi:hypothetical protein C8Q77DRAFT_1114166 [Trametes polyzona]|nr:hypothetical protein C8Q77DRAFT_1114166 [Trametes polyzona]
MSSDSDSLSHFMPLDELIQVIYQGSSRFVIVSAVDDASWTVHVGLTGDDVRWWRGRWTEKDVREVIGSNVSGFLLDSFVEKLADSFVKGEMSIGGWSSDRTAPIQLVFGSHVAKTPINVTLNELPLQEAITYATKVFTEIALQAQSRKCRLYSSTFDLPNAPVALPAAGTSRSRRSPERSSALPSKSHSPHRPKGKEKSHDTATTADHRYKRKAEEAEEEIEALKVELERTKRQGGAFTASSSKPHSKNKPAATATRPKGLSLANPTKKARKYKPIEFESDED